MTIHSGKVSPHFFWSEVEKSETAERSGIDNSVPFSLEKTIRSTAQNMEIVRTILAQQILVSSWYRCPALQALPQFYNPTSQHPRGEAVDFTCPAFGPPIQICKLIMSQPEIVVFDQLIYEYSWVHISFNSIPNAPQRKQVLTLLDSKGYAKGLTDKKGRPV